MRLVIAVSGVLLFGTIAVLVSARPPSAATTRAVATARYTAAPREAVDPGSDPAARAPTTDTERTVTAHARPRAVRGLALPIAGATLPTDPELLPNSPREYRAGWHEGIDFPAPPGTPVLAVADGVVIRVDTAFVEWTADEEGRALDEAVALGYTPAETLDRLRGRQVWIDHGQGIVSRYAHLSAVAPLVVGARVERGRRIGAVGSSGYEEGGPHLHLEVRVGNAYLGEDLAGDTLIATIFRAFD